MKVFMINSPHTSQVVDLEIPKPNHDEIVILVMACGVCGTDIHIYKGEYFGGYPRVPGHEFCGIVSEVGRDVHNFHIGQHVAADPNIFCEGCDNCKQNHQNFCENFDAAGVSKHGAYAEYVVIPERCVFDIGKIDFDEGAMIEPLSCVVYGQENAGLPIGGHVLIFGAGPIGLMHMQLAKINGAATVSIVDLFPHKLELAKKLGADFAYTADEFKILGKTNAFETVIDCTGVPEVVETEMAYVKDAGTFLMFGVCPEGATIAISPYEIFRREIKIVGSYSLKKTFGKALSLIQHKRINVTDLIDNRVSLEETGAFFECVQDLNPHLKTVVYPTRD